MHRAAGQFPHEPGVDGAGQQFSLPRRLAGAVHAIENPSDLGCREIGIKQQAGGLSHLAFHALVPQDIAEVGCTAVLPDDGRVDRLTAFLIPHHRGFTLIGDAKGGEVGEGLAASLYGFAHDLDRGLEDRHRVMLDPAVRRIGLGQGSRGQRQHLAVARKHHGPGAGRALIERQEHAFGHVMGPLLGGTRINAVFIAVAELCR